MEGGKVLPPLILLLTNQKYSVTKEFIDKFVKWRINRLDESSFTEEKIKEILTKADNLVNFYTKKTYFGTGIRIPEYQLKEDWREAIEKGMVGECGEEFKDLVQIFESVDLNFLVVQFFLDLREEFKNGFLSYQEVDWYVVGDTAKIWGMDIEGLDAEIKLGALKFATEFFINSPKLYKSTTPAKFLARTLSLLWKRAHNEVSDEDLDFVIEFYRELSSDSEDYWSCWMLGEFYRKKNDDEALNWYIESANRRSTSKGYRSLIYILKEYLKDPRLFEDIVELQEKAVIKAIELDAINFRNWNHLGDILEYKGKLFKNQNKYNRAIKNFDDAIKAYEKVKEISEKLLSQNDKFWYNIAIDKIADILTERSRVNRLVGRLEDKINDSFAIGGRLSSKAEDLEIYLDAIRIEPQKIQLNIIPLKENNKMNKRKEIYPKMTLNEILEKSLDDLLSIESGLEDIIALYNKQNAFFKLEKYEKAIECADKILKLEQNSFVFIHKGRALGKLKKYKEALECYDKAIAIEKPINIFALSYKGSTLEKIGELENALDCYNEVIKIKPNNAMAYYGKGRVLSRLKRYGMALECIDKALELSNYQYAPAWIKKGFVLLKLGKYEEALECYNEAINIDPGNVVAFKHRAFELKKTGRYETPIPFSKISKKILKDTLQEINKNPEDYDSIKRIFDEKFSTENKSKTYLMGILDGLASMSLKQASGESPFEKSAKIFQSCQNFCGDLYGEDYKQIFSDLFNTRIISRFKKIVLGNEYNMGPIKSEKEWKDLLKDFERTFGELGVKSPTLDEIRDEVSKVKNKNQGSYELT